MNETLLKLAAEIGWKVTKNFKNVNVEKIKEISFNCYLIAFKSKIILPFSEFFKFYSKMSEKFLYDFKLQFNTIDFNWDINLLKNYINFILEEDLNEIHLALIMASTKIVKDDEISLTFFLQSQNVLNKLSSLDQEIIQGLQNYGFPKLNLDFKMEADKNHYLEIDNEEHKKRSYDFVKKPKIVKTKETSFNKFNKNGYEKMDIQEVRDSFYTKVIIEGEIFKVEEKEIRNRDLTIFQINVKDKNDAIFCKVFVKKNSNRVNTDDFKVGNKVIIKGSVLDDKYLKEKVISINNLKVIEYNRFLLSQDHADYKRVELCTRTKMSAFDGVIDIKKLIDLAANWGHAAVGITDLDNVQAYPNAYNYAKKYPKLKILYGITFSTIFKNLKTVLHSDKSNLSRGKYVVFDLETTGLSAKFNRIIEFGAVKINNGIIIERKQFFININEAIPMHITKLTNITNKNVESGLDEELALSKILEFFEDAILVAHNASFDIKFIYALLEKYHKTLISNPVIDTLMLSRLLLKQKSYNLQRVSKTYDVNYDTSIAHRADYDAEILAQIFGKMLSSLKQRKILTLNDLNNWKTDDIYSKLFSNEITVFAKNQQGLKTLFKLVSKAHTEKTSSKVVVFEEEILKNRENLLIGSSSYRSTLFELAINGRTSQLEKEILKYDFIEVQPIKNYAHLINRKFISKKNLELAIKELIEVAKKNNKIVVATTHARYLKKEEKVFHKIYINTKALGGVPHNLFKYKEENPKYPDLFLRNTKELITEFSFLENEKLIHEIVVKNSNLIANQIEKIKIIKEKLYTPKMDNMDEKIRKIIYENARAQYGAKLPKLIIDRIEKELNSVTKYEYSVIYWLSHKLVKKSLSDGFVVGSRGSIGSSLIATFLNITEVNPLAPHYFCTKCYINEFPSVVGIYCGYDLPEKNCPSCKNKFEKDGHDIPFETFLGFEGDKVPDIDLNFSGIYQSTIHREVTKLFDSNHAFRAGTISTVAEKTAYGYVMGYAEKNDLKLSKAYMEWLVDGIKGTKRTTGQHPGGIIVIPTEFDVEEFTPVNYPANDLNSEWKTTHFDFHAIHDNVLKLDLLGHDDPTALKMLTDLTKIDITKIPNSDPKVIDIFNSPKNLGVTSNDIMGEKTGILGIPEFGTSFVRKMVNGVKIKSFADLVSISGLSHGTDVWINNAEKLVKKNKLKLSEIISCRDDIMTFLMSIGMDAQLAFNIMEKVRKGKGLTDKDIVLMKKYKIPTWYIDSCQKIKYIFPKAHATAYVKMAWRIAWFKVYYPLEYYATFFTTRTSFFDIFLMVKGKEFIEKKLTELISRSKSQKLRNSKSIKLTAKEESLITPLKLAQEMNARGFKILNIDIEKSDAENWLIDYDQNALLPPFNTIDGLGIAAAKSIIKARKVKSFSSIEAFEKTTSVNQTIIAKLRKNGVFDNYSEKNQIQFKLF